MKSYLKPALWCGLAFLGGVAGSLVGEPLRSQASVIDQSQNHRLVGTFGVGGVVTADGQFWQYRPDKDKWLSLDESFSLEGQGTSIEPLPLPMTEIRYLETFGFLIDMSDECWLYDLEKRVWRNVGAPPNK